MRKALLLALIYWSAVLLSFAQERTMKGVVTDPSGATLPGVAVVVKGTTNGTVTNLDGEYTLNVNEGDVLVYKLIGFASQTRTVGAESSIDITLEEDVEELEEVVVTALGVKRDERSLGYSVQNVSGESMSEVKSTNLVNGLSGKVAGVQVSSSGTMGGSSRIVIRGVNSVTGNNQPLFVVDGVPIDNSSFTTDDQARGSGGYDYGNAAQDINPDDIESMSILKGASAAALYGSRAANGVVMITTKKGKGKSNRIGVSVFGGVTFDNVLKLPDYQNSYGGGFDTFQVDANGNEIVDQNGNPYVQYAVDESWGPRLNGRNVRQWYSLYEDSDSVATPWVANPNNVRDFFKTGITSTAGFSTSGSNDNSNFRFGYTNMHVNGVFPNSEMDRNTFSFTGSHDLTEKFTVSVGANYVTTTALGRATTGYDGNNVMQQFNQWGQRQWNNDRMKYYKNADGTQRTWNRRSIDDPTPQYTDNPYWIRHENYQDDDRNRFFGNAALNYQLNDSWSASVKAMTDFYTDYRRERKAVGSQEISYYNEDVYYVQESNFEGMVRYNKTFDNEFSVNAFVGGNFRLNSFRRNYQSTSNGLAVPNLYTTGNSLGPVLTVDDGSDKKVASIFGSGSFGFRNTYFVDLSLRGDQSSTLPKDNNIYLYPAVSASVVFSELFGIENSEKISFGKLRLGWAQVGNDTDPYRLKQTYSVDNRGSFAGNPMYYNPNTLNYENLSPEKTTSYEVGLDMRFFNERVGFDVTYYNNISTDQIIDLPTTVASGFTRQLINAGKMLNRGVELAINTTPVITESGFTWDLGFNYAKNYNELQELAPGIDNLRLANAPFAVTVNATVGETYGQIKGRTYKYSDSGQKLVTDNGLYAKSDIVNLGSTLPDWTGGITNSFQYKGITLRFLIDMRFGGKIFSTTNMFGKYAGMLEETENHEVRANGIIVDGVKESDPSQANDVRISAIEHYQLNYGFTINSEDVYDASFVKLKEVAISYRLPTTWTEKIGSYGATFSVTGRNLWIIHSNVPHLDPDFANNSGNVQGIEGGAVPTTRSLGVNLKIDF